MYKLLPKQLLLRFLQGVAIGVANLVPGISGGTLAVILSIYDELIEALSQFFSIQSKKKQTLLFLMPIGFGAICGIVVFSKVIFYFLDVFPQPTYFFFIGLILGTFPLIIRKNTTRFEIKNGLIAVAMLVSISLMIFINTESINTIQSTLTFQKGMVLFFSGLIAAATMVLPGISGSLILLLIGQYSYILQAIYTFDMPVLSIVFVGALLGIMIMTKLIHWLLCHKPGMTYYAILGLMGGSVIKMFPGFSQLSDNLISLLLLGFGVFLALSLNKKKHE